MSSGNSEDESIGTLLVRLVDDAKGFASAEIGYYRTLAAERLGEARGGLIAGAAALVLAFALIIALLVGLVLTLAPLVGPGLATLIVVVAAGVAAALLGRVAIARIKHALRPTKRPEP